MKSHLKKLIALVGLLTLTVSALRAQDSGALVDALVKKGVLTDQEAEEIRSDLAKDYATSSAGKLNLSNHITQLTLYGDARFRYEYDSVRSQTVNTENNQANYEQWRARYRIRVGADYRFTDNFNAGFELESASTNDGANQTMGAGFSKFTINVGLLYLNYKPWDFVTLTGGKFRNPLYTTDLVWDPDINPEGAAEIFSWNINDQFSLGLTTEQLYYADNVESANYATANDTPGVANNTQDSWIFVAQAPATYKFTKDISTTIAPTFYARTGGSTSAFGTAQSGQATGSNIGAPVLASPEGNSYLTQIAAPGDVSFKLFGQKAKFYWDFIYNADGRDRIVNVYGINNSQNHDLNDDIAWLAGFQLGENKKKGDWLVAIDFRQIGLGSVDPNLNDSDFGDGFLNQQGIKIRTGYNFTDFLTGNITYYDTWNYKETLSTSGTISSTGLPSAIAGINTSSRLQLDLNWKF